MVLRVRYGLAMLAAWAGTLILIPSIVQAEIGDLGAKDTQIKPTKVIEDVGLNNCRNKNSKCEVGIRLGKVEKMSDGTYFCEAYSAGTIGFKGYIDNYEYKVLGKGEISWSVEGADSERGYSVRFPENRPALKIDYDNKRCVSGVVEKRDLFGKLIDGKWVLRSGEIEAIINSGDDYHQKKRNLEKIPRIECYFRINLEFSDDNKKTWKKCEPIDPVVVNKD